MKKQKGDSHLIIKRIGQLLFVGLITVLLGGLIIAYNASMTLR